MDNSKISYNGWDTNEPGNGQGQNINEQETCMGMGSWNTNHWFDIGCSVPLNMVCQYRVNSSK